MSPKNVRRRPLGLFFLLLEALAVLTLALPLTDPLSPPNNSTIEPPAASSTPPLDGRILPQKNATTPPGLGLLPLVNNMFDYHVVGTALTLRITATGRPLTRPAVNAVTDAAIRRVVAKINTGFGNEPIDGGEFVMQAARVCIDVHVGALANADLTYFLLGDVLAGAWQYMNEPWSSFREIDFDIIVDRGAWYYVGYGGFGKYEPIPPPSPPPPPEPSFSLCRDSTSGLNEIG